MFVVAMQQQGTAVLFGSMLYTRYEDAEKKLALDKAAGMTYMKIFELREDPERLARVRKDFEKLSLPPPKAPTIQHLDIYA